MSVPGRFTAGDYAAALAVVVIWGLNFVAMKLALQGLTPMVLGALRFGMASLPVILFIARPRMGWRFLIGYGIVQGMGQFGLLFTAIALGMPAGIASLVIQTQAFFTALLAAPVLGERAHSHQWLGLAVAAAGLGAIASTHGQGPTQMPIAGLVLTLGAALMWAVSNLIVRRAARATPNYDPLAFIVWTSLVPVLPFLAINAMHEGVGPTVAMVLGMTWVELAAGAFLGIFATLLAYTLWTRLLKRHPTSRVAPFSLLVPVVGLWAAWLAFGERLLPLQWAGVALVLLGLLVNQLGGRLRRGRAPA